MDRPRWAALAISAVMHGAALAAFVWPGRHGGPTLATPVASAVMQVSLIELAPERPVETVRSTDAPKPAIRRAKPPAKPVPVAKKATAVQETPVVTADSRQPAAASQVAASSKPEIPADSAAQAAAAGSEFAGQPSESAGEILVREPHFRRPPQPPTYPQLSRSRGESGIVLVQAKVESDGAISELRIARSSGHSRLDKAALAAVRGWEIEPYRRNQVALAAWVELPVVFELRARDNVARRQ